MAAAVFIVLAVLTIGGGVGVVVTRNVVHAALALLVSLIAVAGLYLVLFAEFLALVQVLIYGGAIIIVLLFAIMLTRNSEYPRITDNKQWPLAALAAFSPLLPLALACVVALAAGFSFGFPSACPVFATFSMSRCRCLTSRIPALTPSLLGFARAL